MWVGLRLRLRFLYIKVSFIIGFNQYFILLSNWMQTTLASDYLIMLGKIKLKQAGLSRAKLELSFDS